MPSFWSVEKGGSPQHPGWTSYLGLPSVWPRSFPCYCALANSQTRCTWFVQEEDLCPKRHCSLLQPTQLWYLSALPWHVDNSGTSTCLYPAFHLGLLTSSWAGHHPQAKLNAPVSWHQNQSLLLEPDMTYQWVHDVWAFWIGSAVQNLKNHVSHQGWYIL